MVDLRVATLTGPETTLQEAAIEEFNKSLGGDLILPGLWDKWAIPLLGA